MRSPEDVTRLVNEGADAVLVGEALMRAPSPAAAARAMVAAARDGDAVVIVKVCGVRTPEIAEAAIDAGADWIGLMLVREELRAGSMTRRRSAVVRRRSRAGGPGRGLRRAERRRVRRGGVALPPRRRPGARRLRPRTW